MRIPINGGHISINDNNPLAIKIRQGYEYSLDKEGNLSVGTNKVNYDLDTFQKKLENKTATLTDVQEYLLSKTKKEYLLTIIKK